MIDITGKQSPSGKIQHLQLRDTATTGDLAATLAEQEGVAVSQIVLIHRGAVLKAGDLREICGAADRLDVVFIVKKTHPATMVAPAPAATPPTTSSPPKTAPSLTEFEGELLVDAVLDSTNQTTVLQFEADATVGKLVSELSDRHGCSKSEVLLTCSGTVLAKRKERLTDAASATFKGNRIEVTYRIQKSKPAAASAGTMSYRQNIAHAQVD